MECGWPPLSISLAGPARRGCAPPRRPTACDPRPNRTATGGEAARRPPVPGRPPPLSILLARGHGAVNRKKKKDKQIGSIATWFGVL